MRRIALVVCTVVLSGCAGSSGMMSLGAPGVIGRIPWLDKKCAEAYPNLPDCKYNPFKGRWIR